MVPLTDVPWTGVGKRIEKLVRKACYEFELLDGAGGLAVALSGGKDSLTLLSMLKALSGHGFPPLELYAIHVSGAFSCGPGVPMSLLRDLCDRWGVSLVVVESAEASPPQECYSCSRRRRRLLFDTAKRLGVNRLAFGHHRDDSIQTLLMNLLQKGEFEGNLPKLKMHRYGVTILRPLIFVGEEEIRTFASQQGFLRLMCQCPRGQQSRRKEAGRLIQEMEQCYPLARHNLARAAWSYQSGKAALE